MKKALFAVFIIASTAGVALAEQGQAYSRDSNKFVRNLNLEPSRADQVQAILRSYSTIKELYTNNRRDEIPAFLAQKEAELAAVLTPAELEQFKSDVAAWAANNEFSRSMHFSNMSKWSNKGSSN